MAAHAKPASLVLLGVVTLLAAGCRKLSPQEVFPVGGVVTVNGESAPKASLAFHPLDRDSNSLCPVGRTDNHGKFHLTTFSNFDGAPPGNYAVTIVWPDDSSFTDDCNCSEPLQHDRLKGLYANADQTDFRVTVQRAANSFQFDAWRPRNDEAPR